MNHRVLLVLVTAALLLGLAVAAPIWADRTLPITINPAVNNLTLNEGETLTETITVTVPAGASSSKVDVYLLADTTGSMYSPIDAVQQGASDIVSGLIADLPEVDLAFGVGNFKDFPGDPYCYDHQLGVTTTVSAIEAAIAAWEADGGNDGSEGQFYALDQLAEDRDPAGGQVGWRGGVEKIVVLFGDAPAHDPICPAISGLAYEITESSLITKLQESGISLVLISTLTGYTEGLDDNPQIDAWDYTDFCIIGGASGQGTRLATATGGAHLQGVDAQTIVQAIKDLITAQVQTINTLSLLAVGDAAPFVTSIQPPSYGPLDAEVEHALPFEVRFTGVEPCGEVPQSWSGAIQVLADGAVATQKELTVNVPACSAAPSYSMQFSAGPGAICPGWNLYYDLSFVNLAQPDRGTALAGDAGIHNLIVTTTLPLGTWVYPPEITGTMPSAYDPASHTITWMTALVGPGQTAEAHLVLRTYTSLAGDAVTTTFHYGMDGLEEPGLMHAVHEVDRSLCAPTITPTATPSRTPTITPTETAKPEPTPTSTPTQAPLYLPLAMKGE